MIANILNWFSGFFQNTFSVILKFLGDLFGYLFQGLINVLKAIFKPILILVAVIFYFIYKLGVLVITLFSVLLGIGKLLYSFVSGLFRTLAGLTWTPTTPQHGSWSQPIRNVFDALSLYQLDKIAYVLLFAIWIMTAVAAIRILARER